MSQKINKPSDAFGLIGDIRDELISVVIRMEKVLRTSGCSTMRADVKKLRELLK